MNEDQADRIITILDEIKDLLNNILIHTADISSIDSNTSETADRLRKMQNSLR
jgi:hypothetical protein